MAERKIRLVRRIDKIKLQHVGNRGPQGIQGIQGDPATNIVQSVNGKIGTVVLQKQDIGLDQVDNTSDANKPVSTAQQAALDTKATTTALNAHASSTTNPHQVTKAQVGLGNVDNTSDTNKPISTATQAALDTKATTTALDAHANDTLNPHQVTKAQVGLGNANNTSDANKPVSTATQSALDLKANTSALAPVALSGAFSDLTGTPSIVNTVTGTANQVIASGASGDVTLSLPQDIGTGSSPTFGGAYLTNALLANRTSTGIAFQALAGGTPDSTGGTGIIAGLAATSPITAAGQRIAYYGYRANSTNSALIAAYSTDSWTSGTGTYLNFELTPTGSNLRGPYAQLSSVGLALGPSATPTHTLTLNSTATGIALYNTADQTTNYERVRQYWTSNTYTISAEAGGTGAPRAIRITSNGSVNGYIQTRNTWTGAGAITSYLDSASASTVIHGIAGIQSASSTVQTGLAVMPTITQTGTAGYTALLVNPTESTTGSGAKLLIDAQVGGTTKFKVDNTGRTDGSTIVASGVFRSNSGLVNDASSLNAAVNTVSTGTTITRNIADTNPALAVTQTHASSTGDILQLKNSGGTVASFKQNGVFFPVQAPTASAPTYVKGGIYFDTTKNKLMVGGASAWETSATDYSDLTGIPQDISTTASPTFNNLTANGYLFAGGNYNAAPTTPGIYAGIPTGLSPRFTMVPTSGNVRAFDNAAGGIVRLINSSTGTIQMVASANGLFAFGPSLFGLDPTHTITLPSTATGIALYNTADQTTNYERLRTYWSGNTAFISTERGGTGVGRPLALVGANSSQLTLSDAGYAATIKRDFTGIGILNVTSSSMIASSGNQVVTAITPTYNQTGTAGSTDLIINRTETALGSGSHSFVDLQVGGSSRFTIYRSGALSTSVVGGSQGFTINAAPATAYLDNNISNTLTGSTANQANLHFLVKDSAGDSLRALQWINKLSDITVGSRQSYVGLTVYDTDAQATALEFWGKHMTVYGNITLVNGMNIGTGTTTGTKIGTSAANKLSLWGKTPIAQPTTAIAASTFTANTGTAINDASTFGGYTLKQIAQALINVGLLA